MSTYEVLTLNHEVKTGKKHMRQHSRKIVIRIAIIIFFMIVTTYICLHTGRIDINEPNQFALLFRYSPEDGKSYPVPLRIKEGILYAYGEDDTWSAVELAGKASQVFSGEDLCVLLEDGSIYYDGITELPQQESDENFSVLAAYTVEMERKIVELNETEPFLAVSQNITDPNFSALLESGELVCKTDSDGLRRYTLPEEKPEKLSGAFILTEDGNVYYLYGEAEMLYDGGDIAAISADATKSSCIGIKENGEVLSWVGSDSGWNKTWAYDVSEWKNIVAVQAGFYFVVGLDADGKVYFAMDDKKCEAAVIEDLSEWSDVTGIAVECGTIVGMRADGSCLFLDVGEYL